MSRGLKRLWAILLVVVLVGFMPAGGVLAETAPENVVTSEETTIAEDGQETIEEEEVPLAEPNVNTVAFMWCGIAMVIVLASITGYASFGKEQTVRR